MILEIYKYQPYLEKCFSQIKTDLAISPVFLKTPIRAAALLDVYFIAIAVSSLMERDIRKAMKEAGIARLPLYPEGRETSAPTTQRVLETFASVGWHEFQRGAETICFPLEMSDPGVPRNRVRYNRASILGFRNENQMKRLLTRRRQYGQHGYLCNAASNNRY